MDYTFRGINKKIYEKTGAIVWVYGSYLKHLPVSSVTKKGLQHLILKDEFRDWGFPQEIKTTEVLPNSVSRSTNKIDKNNKFIFSLDQIKLNDFTYFVKENEIGFYLENENECIFDFKLIDETKKENIEIVGFNDK